MPKRSKDVSEEYTTYEQKLAGDIGARIRLRRRQVGLSQQEVRANMALEQVYISRSHYSRTETGQNLPRASEIIALTRALDVSCEWLLLGDKAD